MGSRNRTAGHNYEREIRREFIEDGWVTCETARYASREKDDQKVDLCRTEPFNVQSKWQKKLMNFHNYLVDKMPDDDNYNLVYYKRNNGNKPWTSEIVVLLPDDWFELQEMVVTNTDYRKEDFNHISKSGKYQFDFWEHITNEMPQKGVNVLHFEREVDGVESEDITILKREQFRHLKKQLKDEEVI